MFNVMVYFDCFFYFFLVFTCSFLYVVTHWSRLTSPGSQVASRFFGLVTFLTWTAGDDVFFLTNLQKICVYIYIYRYCYFFNMCFIHFPKQRLRMEERERCFTTDNLTLPQESICFMRQSCLPFYGELERDRHSPRKSKDSLTKHWENFTS